MAKAITVDQLQVLITANAKDLDDKLSKIANDLNGTSKSADKFSKMGTLAFGAVAGAASALANKGINMVTNSIDGAIKRVDILNNAPKVLQNLGFSAEEAAKAITQIDKGTRGLPTSLDQIATSLVSIASASGLGIDEATELTVAFNNMALAGGKGSADAERALVQFTQALGRGKFQVQDFNILLEVMPAQLQQVAKTLLGASANTGQLRDALTSGEVSMDDFNDAIMKLNKKGGKGFASFADQAKTATGGIGTAISLVATSVTRGVGEILKAVGSDKIAGAFGNMRTAIDNVFKYVVAQVPKVMSSLSTLATTVGDYLGPKFQALWSIIQTQLIPALTHLSQTIILPLATMLGTVFVAALGLTIDALSILLQVTTFLYETLHPFIPVIMGLVAAYTAYQVIAGIVAGVQLALNGAMVAGTVGTGAYALGVKAVTLAQTAAATATTLWQSALSLLNPVTLGLAAAVTAVVVAVEAVKLAKMNANLEAQNTITMEEREIQLRQMSEDAINAQKEALEGYTSAKQEETNAALALMNAEDQETAAKKRLDDMTRNGVDPASREYKRAQLELEAASGRVKTAQDKLSESSSVAKEKFDDVGDAVWAQIRASKEDELQKLAQAGKYDLVNQKLRDLAKETHNYKDANGEMTKFSERDMNAMALAIGDSLSKVHKDYSKFWDASQESVDKAARNVAEVKTQFTASGRSFSQGVAEGINANSWQAENAARNTALKANAAFNRTLNIHSPSRVMKKGGGFFSLGIAEGISDKTSEVIDAAHTMANKLIKAADFSALSDISVGNFDSSINVQHGFSDFTNDGNSQPLIINVGGERLVDTVIQGINGRSFLGGSSVINV